MQYSWGSLKYFLSVIPAKALSSAGEQDHRQPGEERSDLIHTVQKTNAPFRHFLYKKNLLLTLKFLGFRTVWTFVFPGHDFCFYSLIKNTCFLYQHIEFSFGKKISKDRILRAQSVVVTEKFTTGISLYQNQHQHYWSIFHTRFDARWFLQLHTTSKSSKQNTKMPLNFHSNKDTDHDSR